METLNVTTLLLSLAQNAPATVVLAFALYRLDQRLAGMQETIQDTLTKLADAALAQPVTRTQ